MKKTNALFVLMIAIAFSGNVASSNRSAPKTETAFSILPDVKVAEITFNNPVVPIYSFDYLNADVNVITVTYHLENPDLNVPTQRGFAKVPSVSIAEHRKPPRSYLRT